MAGGKADGNEEAGSFVGRAMEDAGEEGHGAGSVGERGEAHAVERGDKEAGSDADGFLDIVVLDFARRPLERRDEAIILAEDDDEPGSELEEGFVPIGAEGSESGEPIAGHAARIIFLFFRFGGETDAALDERIADNDEMPGLLIGAGGSAGGDADGRFDEVERDRAGRELADGAARGHAAFELTCAEGLGGGCEWRPWQGQEWVADFGGQEELLSRGRSIPPVEEGG